LEVLLQHEGAEGVTTLPVPSGSKFSDMLALASKHFGEKFSAISFCGEALAENDAVADYFEPGGIFVLHIVIRILPNSFASEWDGVLAGWLNAKAPLTLKWQSNDATNVKGFHKACDRVPNTLVIVKSKEGNVFGGFSVTAWASNQVFKADPTGLSFVFVLKNAFGDPPTRFPLGNRREAIFCSGNCGPNFCGTFGVWSGDLHPPCSWVQFRPQATSYVDALGRGVAAFASSECETRVEGRRYFELESLEVWAAAGPPTSCA
jgi:hypothetical protein